MMTPAKSVLALALIAALSACGGGGGGKTNGDDGGGSGGDVGAGAGSGGQATLLPCTNTSTTQCSGGTVLRTENSVTMTDSGVQVYGISTSDTSAAPKEEKARAALVAWGLAPSNPNWGGVAEVRLQKDAVGIVTRAGLLLSNIGASWDAKTMRPPTIEIFTNSQGYPTQGRVSLVQTDPNRSIRLGPLPPSTDLDFYDWANKGPAGTQEHYANNVYFPRSEKIRCDGNPGCPEDYDWYAKKQQPTFDQSPGEWRNIGNGNVNIRQVADEFRILRFHEDGDLRAGDAKPGPNGERRYIDDSGDNTGFGVAFPGFKGYRALENYSYQYANLSTWVTTETVEIVEWALGTNEHNALRRGLVAFGKVTDPGSMPSDGIVRYKGAIYGFYAPTTIAQPKPFDPANPDKYETDQDAEQFRGEATIEVNFKAGTATVTFADTTTFNEAAKPVPAQFTVTPRIGANGGPRNYFTGSLNSASNGTREGGISARFFGPVAGGAPAEIGGALSFTYTPINAGPNGRQTVIAGFLARKL